MHRTKVRVVEDALDATFFSGVVERVIVVVRLLF